MVEMAKQDEEFIAEIRAGLLDLFGGDEKSVEKWLNSPNPAFDGEVPQEMIDAGEAELLAELVEHILMGGYV